MLKAVNIIVFAGSCVCCVLNTVTVLVLMLTLCFFGLKKTHSSCYFGLVNRVYILLYKVIPYRLNQIIVHYSRNKL